MGAVVALQGADGLAVEPGQSVSCQLSLANTGTIVEQFTLLFLGDVVGWVSADPPVVSLFPGAQQTVTITFSPPRDPTTRAGEVHFGVKVIPSNEPDESVTEEGTILVGAFTDIGAELLPRVATGRLAGRQRLAVDSRGNAPVPVEVAAVDAADALLFSISPSRLTAAPGAAHFVRVRVRPRRRFWRGPPQQKPYQVQVAVEGERPVVLDGGFSQRAVLPKWVPLVVALIAAAVLLWFFVLRPAVRNTAVNANKAALAAQTAKANQLANQLNAAKAANAANAAGVAANSAALAALSGKPVPTTTTSTSTTTTTTLAVPVTTGAPTTTTPPPVTSPTDGRLQVVAGPGATATDGTGAIPAGTTLTVSDLIIQNVSGSAGTARIERVAGGKTTDLLVENLASLTDQEYTLSTPMIFTHGQQMVLRVDCSGAQTACNVGVYYTGPITQPAADTTTTTP